MISKRSQIFKLVYAVRGFSGRHFSWWPERLLFMEEANYRVCLGVHRSLVDYSEAGEDELF